MKKRNSAPKGARGPADRASRPATTSNRPGGSFNGPFKRAKPEVESRFSKPSVKRSSLTLPYSDKSQGTSKPKDNEGRRPFYENIKSNPETRLDKPGSFGRDRDPKRKFGGPKGTFKPAHETGEKPAGSRFGQHDKPQRPFRREEGDRPFRKDRDESKPYGDRPEGGARSFDEKRKPGFGPQKENRRRPEVPSGEGNQRRVGKLERAPRYDFSRYEDKKKPHGKHPVEEKEGDDQIRLNRYISNAGICSRREADELIASGQISVNGKTITEMGYKVKPADVVKYGKKILNPERMVYIVINKPKDYITTTDDPEERKTVLDLIAGACQERVYPVGRLDRNTTGLLLLTNDGELAEKLTHPSSGVKKVYQAELDKPITTEDYEAMQKGFELEDGFIRPDAIGIVTPDAMVVGLEIHSGRNRIVRRMFEHFGYEVKKLDRTVFAGLNKKDLPRGKWRFLTEKEVVRLKFML